MFSAGQAAFKNNGQGVSANLAEWARDHDLGPVVTFGEWLSYNPPPKGGKPSFSLAVPSGEAVTPSKPPKGKAKASAFVPDIPATLKSLAPSPIAGEGQWRVVEKVKGEPAILTTFLRDATYTSQVNGIASIDQRLVKFSLRPGTEDPGPGQLGRAQLHSGQASARACSPRSTAGSSWTRRAAASTSTASTTARSYKGTASIVYYKNGTIKIGEWGRDFKMNSSIEGVRQNLKLLVDHGKVAANANSNVMSNWGATLGGGYYVWRSGLGITKDGRIVYVYGPALNAQDLGQLLQRAGAVEGMQMDINPAWMKFDYYQAKGKPERPDTGAAAARPSSRARTLTTLPLPATSRRSTRGDNQQDGGPGRGHGATGRGARFGGSPCLASALGARCHHDDAAPAVAEEPAGVRGAAGGRVAWPQ